MTAQDYIPRLHLLGTVLGAAAVVCLVLAGPVRASLPGVNEIAFKVLRDDAPLGHHRISFRREAGTLHVEIDIALEVKLLFLTVFRYRHKNHEVWRDGRLLAIDTETDDDGEAFWLRGRATKSGFAVEGSSGRFLAPAGIMPTSYWNSRTVASTQMLDTQRGRLIEVAVAPAGVETVAIAGRLVEAQRYSVTGDLSLDVWYTAEGEWAKTKFQARGAQVVYEREGKPAVRGDAEGSAPK